ncbi:hypothetical protein TIFTF001_011965 [Ficus carica]|uniref:Uncharacterized protein n=1 Tax=Ficus carica TaxID=3494 RepID=A0AA88D5T9_FICCA|nr:hypothetical protein TIFTF001_011965 [Ficus carica]
MYANQMMMQQVIFELLPNLRFAPVIPPEDLVPPHPLINPPPPQADDDDEAADLGD